MTVQKSLKYQAKGYVHRTHRSKKGRKKKGKQHKLALDRKRRLQELKLKDIE